MAVEEYHSHVSTRPLQHVLIFQSGDLPKRMENCALRGCRVDEDGVTTCDHLACPSCGVGPPVLLQPEDKFYCTVCGVRWGAFERVA